MQTCRPTDATSSLAYCTRKYSALLGDVKPENVVNQCGSGVTACHNLLAMELAGLSGSALYPGSWSEWSQQDNAPVATGDANFTAPENRR